MEKNKGTGAGGKKTTINGSHFEYKTDNEKHLVNFLKIKIKKRYYLESESCKFFKQSVFKDFIRINYSIDFWRNPDEAYILNDKLLLIIEKKNQNTDGTVEDKLWAGVAFKREYEMVFGNIFNIKYIFCVNSFLKEKINSVKEKYITLNRILEENNITVLFGDDEDYFDKLRELIFILSSK